MQHLTDDAGDKVTVIEEGKAKIETAGHVFCNPVQEFNRDISISALSAFARIYAKEKQISPKITDNIPISLTVEDFQFKAGESNEDGLYILEALSATGLRSIRYAKEIAGVKQIVTNDISKIAVEDIKKNVERNGVSDIITPSLDDAIMLMYQHKKNQFDAIDLDPYGCPSIFLDSAVQAVKDGGLLLVTATDMAVLAGNSPETCYVKYGAVSLRMRACHEMALRILLQTIESHANRYGRYIVPQLSISIDFYIRVFVRVYSGAHKCKFTTSKLSMVHNCKGCGNFEFQPLGSVSLNGKQAKFTVPKNCLSSNVCDNCKSTLTMGGPIWTAPMHNQDFVYEILNHAPDHLNTKKRIEGVLNVVLEELPDAPLYHTLENITGVLHAETPKMMLMRSALLNAGYKVSYAHANKTSIKTNAPCSVIWDIMKCWIKNHPVSAKWMERDKITCNILSNPEPTRSYSFALHPEANPTSRSMGFTRFQTNPTAFWGPGSRATAMVGKEKMTKSKKNQGKRKRIDSPQNGDTLNNGDSTANSNSSAKVMHTDADNQN